MRTQSWMAPCLIIALFVLDAGAQAQAVRGAKIALASTDEKFLQCHCAVGDDGELHASNPKINQEETWWLYRVGDPANHQVALANYRNNYYLQRHGGGATNHRAETVAHDLGDSSTWTMVAGTAYGLTSDVVAFRANDGSYLKAYRGGRNADGERGEVYVDMGGPSGDRGWNGWWRMGEVTWNPQPGRDPWTAIGDGINATISGIGDAIAFAFSGNTSPTDTSKETVNCTTLPPPQPSATARRVHAYCPEGDFSGTFYPENDPYANQRVSCDQVIHYLQQPSHRTIQQACDVGFTATKGCEGVM